MGSALVRLAVVVWKEWDLRERAMRRSPSDPVFLAKAATVIEEADESGFWLEFMVEIELVDRRKAAPV